MRLARRWGLTITRSYVEVLILQKDLYESIERLAGDTACWAQGERGRLRSGNRSGSCRRVHGRTGRRRGRLTGSHLVGLNVTLSRHNNPNCLWAMIEEM